MTDKYLQIYLHNTTYWEEMIIAQGIVKKNPQYSSVALFEILFPTKDHEDFMEWRHHRNFNQWENEIFSMDDDMFEYYWPMIAKLLLDYQK